MSRVRHQAASFKRRKKTAVKRREQLVVTRYLHGVAISSLQNPRVYLSTKRSFILPCEQKDTSSMLRQVSDFYCLFKIVAISKWNNLTTVTWVETESNMSILR